MAFNEDVAAKVDEKLASAGTARERLQQLLKIYLAEWGAHSHLMRQIVLEFISQPASGATFNEVFARPIERGRLDHRRWSEIRRVRAKIEPETAGLALVAAWNAIAITWAKTGDTASGRGPLADIGPIS